MSDVNESPSFGPDPAVSSHPDLCEQHARHLYQNETFKRKAASQMDRLRVDLITRIEQLVGQACSFIYYKENWQGFADLQAWTIEPECLAPTASWSLRCMDLGISPYFWDWPEQDFDVQGVWEEIVSTGMTWRSTKFTETNDIFRVILFDGKSICSLGFETTRLNAKETGQALDRIHGTGIDGFVADPKFDRTLSHKEWVVLDRLFDDADAEDRILSVNGLELDLDQLEIDKF